ncbi:MAG: lipoate--protein ligase family protein [Tuberibacillus sp.]
MNSMNELLSQPSWRIIDQTTLGPAFDAKASFAIDDALCESVGKGESLPVLRAWVHHRTISLGIQDTRLPHLVQGLQFLTERGYKYIARSSGGLAVVLDEGVLNLSLIFSERERHISIDDGFEAMVALIQKMLESYQLPIEAKEIIGSYCPGRYDLSVDGKKFAGISQRRLRKGAAVQIYLCVTGSGAKRAELIRDFYKMAINGESTKFDYPDIRPEVMASLSELTGQPLTIPHLLKGLYQAFGGKLVPSALTEAEAERYTADFARMVERNQKAFGI